MFQKNKKTVFKTKYKNLNVEENDKNIFRQLCRRKNIEMTKQFHLMLEKEVFDFNNKRE